MHIHIHSKLSENFTLYGLNEDLTMEELIRKICLENHWNPEDKRCFTLYFPDETPLLEKDSSEDLSKISVTELLDIQDMSKGGVILMEQDVQDFRMEKTVITFVGDYRTKIILGNRGFFYMQDVTLQNVTNIGESYSLNKKLFGTVSTRYYYIYIE